MYVTPDVDGGDDASTLRTALEKGGIFGDAYHKFSSSFLSAFGSTFEKERLWKRKKKKHTEHRRLLNKRTEAKKKARMQRQKVEPVPEEEGPEVPTAFIRFRATCRISRGVHGRSGASGRRRGPCMIKVILL